jgi:hypothetical protein
VIKGGTDKATRVPYDSIVSAPVLWVVTQDREISAKRRPAFMITCSWRWLLAPDLGQVYDWTRPSTFIRRSHWCVGTMDPGRALADSGLAVHRMSSASRGMRDRSIRRCDAPCHGRQRKESASAPRKFQRSR